MQDRHWQWLARFLATPHLAEYGLSVHAMLWGLATVLVAGSSIVPGDMDSPYMPPPLVRALLGFWPMLTGAVGLWAVHRRHRRWRMASSLCVLPVWFFLSGFYSTFWPPLVGGVVTYAVAAFGEIIIFVRVRHRFDRWSDAR